jgi:tetratricopeptide (TPR) repeat protein
MSTTNNYGNVGKQVNNPIVYGNFIINGNELGAWLTKKAPKEPPFFAASRDTELHAMHQTLFEQQNDLLLLSGLGGVGKSALAAAYLQRHGKAYHHLAWLPVNDTPKQAMLNLAPAFGLNIRDFKDSEALFEEIGRQLVNVKGRNLIVFDDVNASKPFELPNLAPTWTILLTSRTMQPQIGWTIQKLGVLAPAAAERLFVEFAPSAKKELPVLQQLLKRIDYHTLLVKMLAKNYQQIRHADAQYGLQYLYDALAQHGLLKLGDDHSDAIDDPDYKGLNPQTVENIVRFMYQRQKLSAVQETCLFRIAFLPPQFIPFEHLLLLCHDEAEPNRKMKFAYRHELNELAKMGWLEIEIVGNEQVVCKMHQVVQMIMQEIPQTEENTQLPLTRLNIVLKKHYMPLHQQSDFANYAVYTVKQLTIPSHDKVTLFCCLCDFYVDTGQLVHAKDFADASYTTSEHLSNAYSMSALEQLFAIQRLQDNSKYINMIHNRYNMSVTLERLGIIYQLQGNLVQALTYVERSIRLVKQLHLSNANSATVEERLAGVYATLGRIYQVKGHFNNALRYFRRSLFITEQLHANKSNDTNIQNNLQSAYENLVIIYELKEDWGMALEYVEKNCNLDEQAYKNNPTSESMKNELAYSYGKLAKLHQLQGNLDRAKTYFEKRYLLINLSLTHFATDDPYRLANSYSALGYMYKSEGIVVRAIEYFKKALLLKEQLYERNPTSEPIKSDLAITYSRLGEIYALFDDEDLTTALWYFEKEVKLFEELYEANPTSERMKSGLAIAYSKVSDVYKLKEDLEMALVPFEKAFDLFKQLHEANVDSKSMKNDLAIAYRQKGDIKAAQGDQTEAVALYERAKTLWQELSETTQMPMYQQPINRVQLRQQYFLEQLHEVNKHNLVITYNNKGDFNVAEVDKRRAFTLFKKAKIMAFFLYFKELFSTKKRLRV